jgi:hypothetical protein
MRNDPANRDTTADTQMALLASARLTPDAVLWTVDKNLDALVRRLDLGFRGTCI